MSKEKRPQEASPRTKNQPDEPQRDEPGGGEPAGDDRSRGVFLALALAPLVLVLATAVEVLLSGPDRGTVYLGGLTLAAWLGAFFPLAAMAYRDERLGLGARLGWGLSLLLLAPLAAPALWLRFGKSAPASLVTKIAEGWLPVGRGAAVATLGLGASFLMMANEEQVHRGPLWGFFALLVGLVGVLDLLGLFRRGEGGDRVSVRATALFAQEGEPFALGPIVTVPLAIAVLLGGALAFGYDHLTSTIVVALAILVPSAVRRPGLFVFVIAGFLYLPFLGAYGLWDPWETHYGEVAREMLSRDDWISLWWAQEDWFWSKPILIFWSEALSMGALGVDFHPDANPAHPEWAIRLPHFLLTTGALLAVYALVSRVWSKRAGLVTAIVLATMPHFFFLSHQAITDMPFVSCMTMAMCMLGLAIVEDPKREVKRYALGPITVSGRHLLIVALSAVVLPQILYLCSRNVTFMELGAPFGWHGDVFLHGSAGNHGVPGNASVHNVEPAVPALQPILQGLFWLLLYGLAMLFVGREKRAQQLYVFAFYLFCGLAFMAKGIPGFALPGLVALFFLIGARRWDLLLEGKLRVAVGVLLVAGTGMPWYVAMYVRHGPPFLERLLVHDHINRLTSGVHGDTGSIEYFVEQLGYGLFPWIALAPLALARWLETRGPGKDADVGARRRREVTILVTLWLMSAFTLFSAMTTKFHHYIFPTVPAAGILVGLSVDRLLGPRAERFAWRSFFAAVLGVLAPLPAVLGVAGLWGDVRGVIPEELEGAAAVDWVLAHPWPAPTCWALILLSCGLLAGTVWLLRPATKESAPSASWKPAAMTTGLLAAPVLVGLVGRDLSWVTDARPQGYERLIHLFVYNYGRPWPEGLDYRPILTGFAIVATLVVVLAAARSLRGAATRAFLGVALAFTVWCLDVYMIDLSPHWGQRELVQRYYELRESPDEPLVAWQMNWKGENFYTGNRVSVFVDLDNRKLTEWVRQNQGRTAYFLLEHSRLGSLRSVLGSSAIDEISTERLNNKFLLIRAVLGQRAPSPGTREDLD